MTQPISLIMFLTSSVKGILLMVNRHYVFMPKVKYFVTFPLYHQNSTYMKFCQKRVLCFRPLQFKPICLFWGNGWIQTNISLLLVHKAVAKESWLRRHLLRFEKLWKLTSRQYFVTLKPMPNTLSKNCIKFVWRQIQELVNY